MIALKKNAVEELRKILKEEYALDMSFEQASEVGSALVKYFEILLKAQHKIKEKNGKDDDTRIQ